MSLEKPARRELRPRKPIARTSRPARSSKPVARKTRISKRPKASRKKLARYADSLWSAIVRRRDTCELQRYLPHECKGGWQAQHMISRRYHATRWDLRNGLCGCAGIHLRLTYDPLRQDYVNRTRWGQALTEEMRAKALENAKQDLPQIVAALEAVLRTDAADPGVEQRRCA